MTERAAIEEFLAQRTLAFVGVSRDPRQFANQVYRTMRAGHRRLLPVNRGVQPGEQIEGDLAFRCLADIPGPVDGVVVMVAGPLAAEVVREAAAQGIPRVWLYRGIGRGSATDEAVAECRQLGLLVVDGACPLMYEPPVRGIHRLHRMLTRHPAA